MPHLILSCGHHTRSYEFKTVVEEVFLKNETPRNRSFLWGLGWALQINFFNQPLILLRLSKDNVA